MSRRIDVVGCGNAVRKKGRKEGKRKKIDVGCSNAGSKEEEEEGGVVGWSLGVSRFLDFVYNEEG